MREKDKAKTILDNAVKKALSIHKTRRPKLSECFPVELVGDWVIFRQACGTWYAVNSRALVNTISAGSYAGLKRKIPKNSTKFEGEGVRVTFRRYVGYGKGDHGYNNGFAVITGTLVGAVQAVPRYSRTDYDAEVLGDDGETYGVTASELHELTPTPLKRKRDALKRKYKKAEVAYEKANAKAFPKLPEIINEDILKKIAARQKRRGLIK